MTGHALARPAARSPRATALAVLLSALAGLLASLAVTSLVAGGDDATTSAGATVAVAGSPFTIAAPAGWEALSPARLGAIASHPAALVRSLDGRGLVTVRRSSPIRATGAQLVNSLGRKLRPQFPGLRVVSARFTQTRAGRAFLYTFVRDSGRTVQSLALVSAHGQAYEIDAVVPAGAPGAARAAGAILASFGP
jgi:hypothetical protein